MWADDTLEDIKSTSRCIHPVIIKYAQSQNIWKSNNKVFGSKKTWVLNKESQIDSIINIIRIW
jgi:hypothetical protein